MSKNFTCNGMNRRCVFRRHSEGLCVCVCVCVLCVCVCVCCVCVLCVCASVYMYVCVRLCARQMDGDSGICSYSHDSTHHDAHVRNEKRVCTQGSPGTIVHAHMSPHLRVVDKGRDYLLP